MKGTGRNGVELGQRQQAHSGKDAASNDFAALATRTSFSCHWYWDQHDAGDSGGATLKVVVVVRNADIDGNGVCMKIISEPFVAYSCWSQVIVQQRSVLFQCSPLLFQRVPVARPLKTPPTEQNMRIYTQERRTTITKAHWGLISLRSIVGPFLMLARASMRFYRWYYLYAGDNYQPKTVLRQTPKVNSRWILMTIYDCYLQTLKGTRK